jgi:hypothetical protein
MEIMFSFKRTTALIAVIGAVIFFSTRATVNAQTANQPQILITWQAQGSYVPSGYHDKALPNWASPVTASVVLIADGRLVNLQNKTIYWYVNDQLIGGGQDIQSVSFVPPGGAPDLVALKVELPQYNNEGLLLHTVQIPVIQPKAVIEANHPTQQFGNNSLALQGTPYFFSITDPSSLSYAWSVNGVSPTAATDPQTLILNVNPSTSPGSVFATALSITDPNQRISASDAVSLTYIKQL